MEEIIVEIMSEEILKNIVRNTVKLQKFYVISGYCIVNYCMKCIPAVLRAATSYVQRVLPVLPLLQIHQPNCQPVCLAEPQ